MTYKIVFHNLDWKGSTFEEKTKAEESLQRAKKRFPGLKITLEEVNQCQPYT